MRTLTTILCLVPFVLSLGCDAPNPEPAAPLLMPFPGASLDGLDLAETPRRGMPAGVYPHEPSEPSEALMIEWLRWVIGQPFDENPVNDPSGALCGVDQDGPVWFLAGTFGGPAERECTIPAGKQLFFPLVNNWCTIAPELGDPDELLALWGADVEAWFDANYANTCALTLRVDGKDVVPDFDELYTTHYLKVMEPFEVDVNPAWAPEYTAGGPMPTLGAGHYARLMPLTPGDHVVEFGGSICGDHPFTTAVTYHLHVEP